MFLPYRELKEVRQLRSWTVVVSLLVVLFRFYPKRLSKVTSSHLPPLHVSTPAPFLGSPTSEDGFRGRVDGYGGRVFRC